MGGGRVRPRGRGGWTASRAAVLRAGTSTGFGYGGKSAASPRHSMRSTAVGWPVPMAVIRLPRSGSTSSSGPTATASTVRSRSTGLSWSVKDPGRLRLTAGRDIDARRAVLRLVGVRLTEQRRSYEQRDSKGQVTRSEQWVEVDGRLFETLPFTEPVLPARLAAGQTFEAEFNCRPRGSGRRRRISGRRCWHGRSTRGGTSRCVRTSTWRRSWTSSSTRTTCDPARRGWRKARCTTRGRPMTRPSRCRPCHRWPRARMWTSR